MKIKIVLGKTVLAVEGHRLNEKRQNAMIVASTSDSLTFADFSSSNGLSKLWAGLDSHWINYGNHAKFGVKCIYIDGEKFEDLSDVEFVN